MSWRREIDYGGVAREYTRRGYTKVFGSTVSCRNGDLSWTWRCDAALIDYMEQKAMTITVHTALFDAAAENVLDFAQRGRNAVRG